jgi:putative ABC transport system permease protein
MLRLALRNLWARKVRVLILVATIASGVSFIVGSLVFGETLTRSFDNLFRTAYEDTDVVVRARTAYDSDFGATRDRIPGPVLDDVRAVPAVRDVAGLVTFFLTPLDAKGSPISTGGAPSFGQVWTGSDADPFRLVDGSAPNADDQAVIDRRTAKAGPFRPGDPIAVVTARGREEFTVAGIATFGDQDSAAGAITVLFRPAVAQRLAGAADEWDEIAVVSDGSLDDAALAERVDAVLPDGVEAVPASVVIEENSNDLASALSFFSILLLVFGAISVVVATFVIVNTFAILVSQRQRELALLRALGASAGQVRRSVLLESAAVGTLGSIVGIVVGLGLAVGLRGLFAAFGVDLPATRLELTPTMIVVGLVVGIGSTVGAAYLPARKASRIPPIAALRDAALPPVRTTVARIVAGILLAVVAAGSLAAGLGGGGITLVGVAALAAIVAMATLAPLFARELARILGAPLPRLRGMTGTLARENAARTPRRTASTAMALAVGAMLVSFLFILTSSVKTSVAATVESGITADFLVQEKSFGPGVPVTVGDAVREAPGVAVASALRVHQVLLDGEVDRVTAVQVDTIARVVALGTVTGDLSDLGTDGLAVSAERARDTGWTVGTVLPVRTANGEGTLTVRAVFSSTKAATLLGEQVVSRAFSDASFNDPTDNRLLVSVTPGVSPDTVRAAITGILAPTPTLEVLDRAEFVDRQAAAVNQVLALFNALLALAILVSGLGIANTLSLSIYERRRELGLLRAVGQTKAQTRSMIRWEGGIIGILGAVLGVVLGLVFGVAIVRSLADQGITELSVPMSLVAVLVIGALFGVAASWRPARRAAKLDILASIGSE